MSNNYDPYKELGIDRDATPDEIRRAYRNRARSTHPDHGGDSSAFHHVRQAYLLLSDKDARARYDETGYAGQQESTSRQYRMEQAALSTVGSALLAAIDSDAVPDRDILEAASSDLEQQVNGISGNLRILKQLLKRYKKLRKAITYNGEGINIAQLVLQVRIAEVAKEIERYELDLEVYELALEKLEEYELDDSGFEEDAAMWRHEVLFGGAATGTGWDTA